MNKIRQFITLGALATASLAVAEKPNIWVYSDFSDPRIQREGGYPRGDQDDVVSLASLLLSANRFHIESIVVGSGPAMNPMGIINDLFIPAYNDHISNLKSGADDYQKTINYQWSSLSANKKLEHRFNVERDYVDLAGYESVNSLIEYAKNNKVYVLGWGPLTEPAIITKHLLNTNQKDILDNITFISHWTKSYIKSISPEMASDPFAVSNTKMDRAAALYLHEEAAKGNVKLVQLGSIGQTGIVDGSVNYPRVDEFGKSQLGQIFASAKYYANKADQSDAATFWVLAKDLGFNIDDFPTDGSLTKEFETEKMEKFKANAPAILDNLVEQINASNGTPLAWSTVSEYFGYSYYRWEHYALYVPEAVPFKIFAPDGSVVKDGNLKRWDNRINIPKKDPGYYSVKLLYPDRTILKNL